METNNEGLGKMWLFYDDDDDVVVVAAVVVVVLLVVVSVVVVVVVVDDDDDDDDDDAGGGGDDDDDDDVMTIMKITSIMIDAHDARQTGHIPWLANKNDTKHCCQIHKVSKNNLFGILMVSQP